MRAALLNKDRKVIGEVFDAPETGSAIEIAGAFTANGEAVNVNSYRISRSKANLAKAVFEQPISKVGDHYTFWCVEDDRVVY